MNNFKNVQVVFRGILK